MVILSALAEVAELAYAHDSNSCSLGIVGSIPTFGIITVLDQDCYSKLKSVNFHCRGVAPAVRQDRASSGRRISPGDLGAERSECETAIEVGSFFIISKGKSTHQVAASAIIGLSLEDTKA